MCEFIDSIPGYILSGFIGGGLGYIIPRMIRHYIEKTALQTVRYPFRQMSEVFLNQLNELNEDFYIITGDGSSFMGLCDPWIYIVLIGRHERMRIIFTHYIEETKSRVDDYIKTLKKLDVNQVQIINTARGATEKGLQAAGINEDRSIVWIKVNVDESGKIEVPVGGRTKYSRKYIGRPLRWYWVKILNKLLKTSTTDDLRKKYEQKLIEKMQREFFIPENKIELLSEVIDEKYYKTTATKSGERILYKISPHFLHYDTRKKQFYYESPIIKEHTSRMILI